MLNLLKIKTTEEKKDNINKVFDRNMDDYLREENLEKVLKI